MSTSPKVKEVMNILRLHDTQPAIVSITPIQAKELLRYNTNNRRVSEDMVNRYAKRMLNNQWKNSNDAISFSEIGELSNGQHRLRAIIKSDKTVNMLVTFNTNNFTDMDRGKSRTISDNIQTDSRFKGTTIATNKNIQQIATSIVKIVKGKADTEEVAIVLQKYGVDMEYLESSGILTGPKGLNAKAISAAFFVAYVSGVDLGLLKHIREVMNTGITESNKDIPIIGLRDKLLLSIGNNGGGKLDQSRFRYTCYCIQAVEKGSESKICKNVEPRYSIDLGI